MSKNDLTYTVVGSWPFPPDMLARDGSEPATDEDRAKVEALCGERAPDWDLDGGSTSIDLLIRDADGRRPFTERWESFGWSIPGDPAVAYVREERRISEGRARLRESALAKLTPEEREALEWYGLDRLN